MVVAVMDSLFPVEAQRTLRTGMMLLKLPMQTNWLSVFVKSARIFTNYKEKKEGHLKEVYVY